MRRPTSCAIPTTRATGARRRAPRASAAARATGSFSGSSSRARRRPASRRVAQRASRSADELDQEWTELVEELRLAIPGVQVLFAFLLVLPFYDSFGKLVALQRYVYFAALISAAVATVLLISPSVNHR